MAQVGFKPMKQPCIFLTTQSLRQNRARGIRTLTKGSEDLYAIHYIIAPKKNETIETT